MPNCSSTGIYGGMRFDIGNGKASGSDGRKGRAGLSSARRPGTYQVAIDHVRGALGTDAPTLPNLLFLTKIAVLLGFWRVFALTKPFCQLTKPFCHSTKLLCQSAKPLCPSTKSFCQSTKPLCRLAKWLGQAKEGLRRSTEGFCQTAKAVGQSTKWFCQVTKQVCRSAEGRRRWFAIGLVRLGAGGRVASVSTQLLVNLTRSSRRHFMTRRGFFGIRPASFRRKESRAEVIV